MMAAWPGRFVTLEGIDGCGKTTQAGLLADSLEGMGHEVVRLREPGGTALGEAIRALLLDPANAGMCERTELLLYEASRAQLVFEQVLPALERGAWVVCDRFYDSTYAYQHGARGIDAALVDECNRLGSGDVVPDATVLLDLDAQDALARATRGGADRMEAEGVAFQRQVRDGYLELARREPGRVRMVGATGTPDEVHGRVLAALSDILSPEAPDAR